MRKPGMERRTGEAEGSRGFRGIFPRWIAGLLQLSGSCLRHLVILMQEVFVAYMNRTSSSCGSAKKRSTARTAASLMCGLLSQIAVSSVNKALHASHFPPSSDFVDATVPMEQPPNHGRDANLDKNPWSTTVISAEEECVSLTFVDVPLQGRSASPLWILLMLAQIALATNNPELMPELQQTVGWDSSLRFLTYTDDTKMSGDVEETVAPFTDDGIRRAVQGVLGHSALTPQRVIEYYSQFLVTPISDVLVSSSVAL